MNNLNKIIEIDISKQARALALLRLTDYAMVLLCSFWVIGILSGLVVGSISADNASTIIGLVIIVSILSFAIFTGWQHVGVIDPKVWSAYSIVFPLLIVFCSFKIRVFLLSILGSLSEAFDEEHYVETTPQQFTELFSAIWTGSTALLGFYNGIKYTSIGATLGVSALTIGYVASEGYKDNKAQTEITEQLESKGITPPDENKECMAKAIARFDNREGIPTPPTVQQTLDQRTIFDKELLEGMKQRGRRYNPEKPQCYILGIELQFPPTETK